MQDKLHILEDLNMLYIRQIALSLEVPRPGCPAAGRCCLQRAGGDVGGCGSARGWMYFNLYGRPFRQCDSGGWGGHL